MRKWFIRIMITISIVLFLFGIYRYNFPRVTIDDINYKEMNVRIDDINEYEESVWANFEIDGEKKGVRIPNSLYNVGDIITVYEFENEFYHSKESVIIEANGAVEYISGGIILFGAIITYACFSSKSDYKNEEDIDIEFEGLKAVTKENFKENMKIINHRVSSSIHPFTIIMWISSFFFVLCSLFSADREQFWFFYIFVSFLCFLIGNSIRVVGSIKYKCKKAIRSNGEVFIADCFYKDKNKEYLYIYDKMDYFIKVCDVNGRVLNECIETNKKLYNAVSKETKLKLLVIKIDGLVKFFVVKIK